MDTTTRIISGVPVQFPFQPYPAQLILMNKLLNALSGHQNALLESPTGTGKTLSLLCASLAWQAAEEQKRLEMNQVVEESSGEDDVIEITQEPPKKRVDIRCNFPSNDDDDFQEKPLWMKQLKDSREMQKKRKPDNLLPQNQPKKIKMDVTPKDPSAPKMKPIRIFYGTRTHSQISNVVKELEKTPYHPKMVVLASRKHYCVHHKISKVQNQDSECLRLLETKQGCAYEKGTNRLTNKFFGNTVWDIEDLAKAGRDLTGCPFFASKKLIKKAQIVFCPYQYLIDSAIRESTGITFENAIIIIDEAHNIEDVCREATSLDVSITHLENANSELQLLIGPYEDLSYPLTNSLGAILDWINESKDTEPPPAGWKGTLLIGILEKVKITYEKWGKLNPKVDSLWAKLSSSAEQANIISAASRRILKRLWGLLGYLFSENLKFIDDFVISLGKGEDKIFSVWCLNPEVGFRILKSAQSIILTSGTLAPFQSLQTELGITFHHTAETNHVINTKKQLFIGSIKRKGPQELKVTYQLTSSTSLQDAIGDAILDYILHIPYGTLVFFPSYTLMEKLIQRWKTTGLYMKIENIKAIFFEPKDSNQEFQHVMDQYRKSSSTESGAAFFAVCRGKISEGLDFGDDYARGVIMIGMPSPNVKDLKVQRKMEYNDKKAKLNSAMLTGEQWYQLQTFRAINQAIGRCIRHKEDFGSILLLDSRFATQNLKNLSKWVRPNIVQYETVQDSIQRLSQFFGEIYT